MSTPVDSPLQFPCRFPVKVMGRAGDDFESLVLDLVTGIVGPVELADVTRRASRHENYVSVTVTFTATSRELLDALYRALSEHERVLLAL